jgi:hypothetical protein
VYKLSLNGVLIEYENSRNLALNGALTEYGEGRWQVISPSLAKWQYEKFHDALARALLEATPVEWPDHIEDAILEAVKMLSPDPESTSPIIRLDESDEAGLDGWVRTNKPE